MFQAIKYGLTNVTNFNGRDARQTFWYFVLFIFVVRFVAGLFVSVPMTARMMGSAFDGARTGVDQAAMQAQMMRSMADMMPTMMWFSVAIGVVTGLLLVASLVRRLHDSDLSGWLVLIPIAIYALQLSMMPGQIQKVMAMMAAMDATKPPNPAAMMQGQGWMALLGWLPIVLILIVGLRRSTDGANRYGEEPATF
jgi:uncharacterized membrane protein YhaH (DUF805 family)